MLDSSAHLRLRSHASGRAAQYDTFYGLWVPRGGVGGEGEASGGEASRCEKEAGGDCTEQEQPIERTVFDQEDTAFSIKRGRFLIEKAVSSPDPAGAEGERRGVSSPAPAGAEGERKGVSSPTPAGAEGERKGGPPPGGPHPIELGLIRVEKVVADERTSDGTLINHSQQFRGGDFGSVDLLRQYGIVAVDTSASGTAASSSGEGGVGRDSTTHDSAAAAAPTTPGKDGPDAPPASSPENLPTNASAYFARLSFPMAKDDCKSGKHGRNGCENAKLLKSAGVAPLLPGVFHSAHELEQYFFFEKPQPYTSEEEVLKDVLLLEAGIFSVGGEYIISSEALRKSDSSDEVVRKADLLPKKELRKKAKAVVKIANTIRHLGNFERIGKTFRQLIFDAQQGIGATESVEVMKLVLTGWIRKKIGDRFGSEPHTVFRVVSLGGRGAAGADQQHGGVVEPTTSEVQSEAEPGAGSCPQVGSCCSQTKKSGAGFVAFSGKAFSFPKHGESAEDEVVSARTVVERAGADPVTSMGGATEVLVDHAISTGKNEASSFAHLQTLFESLNVSVPPPPGFIQAQPQALEERMTNQHLAVMRAWERMTNKHFAVCSDGRAPKPPVAGHTFSSPGAWQNSERVAEAFDEVRVA